MEFPWRSPDEVDNVHVVLVGTTVCRGSALQLCYNENKEINHSFIEVLYEANRTCDQQR